MFTAIKLQDQFKQYEANINENFDQNFNQKIDKKELTCIEEEFLESSPSRSLLTDGVSRILKKDFSRHSKLDDKKKDQMSISIQLMNKLASEKSNSNSLTGSRLQEHLFNQIKSITNIDDQNIRPIETQTYDDRQYMSDRTTKQNLNDKPEQLFKFKQEYLYSKVNADKELQNQNYDMILNNSLASNHQISNENHNNSISNSIFHNKISCNQIDESEQYIDQSQIFSKLQNNKSEARKTGPQSDTKQSEPKKRNKSFNQWRKTQNIKLQEQSDSNQIQIIYQNKTAQNKEQIDNQQQIYQNEIQNQFNKSNFNNYEDQQSFQILETLKNREINDNLNSFSVQINELEMPQLSQAFRSKSSQQPRISDEVINLNRQVPNENKGAIKKSKNQEKQTLQDFIQTKQLFTQISTNNQLTQQSNQDLLEQLLGFKDHHQNQNYESSQQINLNDLVSQKNSIEQIESALNLEKMQSDNLEFDSSVKSEKHLQIQNLKNVQHHIPIATTQKHASNNRFGSYSGLGQYQINLSKNMSINVQKFDEVSIQNDSVLNSHNEINPQQQNIAQNNQQKNYFQKSDSKNNQKQNKKTQNVIETIKIELSPQASEAQITVQQLNSYHQEYLQKNQNKMQQIKISNQNSQNPSPVLTQENNSHRKFTRSPIVSSNKGNHENINLHKKSFLGSPITRIQSNKNFKYGISLYQINKQIEQKEMQKQKNKDSLSQASRNKSVASQSKQVESSHKGQQSIQNKNQKSQIEWHQVCKMIDKIPNGNSLKTRHTFTRSDIIQLISQYKKKMNELEQVVIYEQQKFEKHNREYSGLLEEIKDVKIENKHLQQKLSEVKPTHEAKLEECLQMLRNSMIHNVVCLEFNKDLNDLMNSIQLNTHKLQSTNIQTVLKQIANLQTQHNIFLDQEATDKQNENLKFENNIEIIEQFIYSTVQYLDGYKQEEKVLKIDLENMSSGSDSQQSHNSRNLILNQNKSIKNNHFQSKDMSQDSIHLQSNKNYLDKSKLNGMNQYAYENQSVSNSSFQQREFNTLNSNSKHNTVISSNYLNLLQNREEKSIILKQKEFEMTKQQLLSITPQNRSSKNKRIENKKEILRTYKSNYKSSIKIQQDQQSQSQYHMNENKHIMISQIVKSNDKNKQKSQDKQSSAVIKQSKYKPDTIIRSQQSNSISSLKNNKNDRIQNLKSVVINSKNESAQAQMKYEKIQMKLQNKELQYSVLLEKYEHKTKRVMELQDEIQILMKSTNQIELRKQFQKQIDDLENVYSQCQFQNQSLQKQLKQNQVELYQSQQHVQTSLNQIMYLNETLKQQHQLLEKNDNIADLQSAVISLFNQQISTDLDSITQKDQKILRVLFGDGFFINNKLRDQLVHCKQVAYFFLNDIIISMLDYFENQNKKIQLMTTQINSQSQVAISNLKSVQENSSNFMNYVDQNIENNQMKPQHNAMNKNIREKEDESQRQRKEQKNRIQSSIEMHNSQQLNFEQNNATKQHKDNFNLFENMNLFNIKDESPEDEKKEAQIQSNFEQRKKSGQMINSPDMFTNRSNNSSHRYQKSRIHSKSALGINSQINILKLLTSQNTFMSQIKQKLYQLYDTHDEFREFIGNDRQKENLFRHMSFNIAKLKSKDPSNNLENSVHITAEQFKNQDYFDQKSNKNNLMNNSLFNKNNQQILETEISLRIPQSQNYQLNLKNMNKCDSIDIFNQQIDFDTDRQNYEDSQQQNIKSLKEIATSINKINDSELNIQMLKNDKVSNQKSTLFNENQNYINLKINAGMSIGSVLQNESIQTNDLNQSISPVKQIDEEIDCTDINEHFVHNYNQNSSQAFIQTPVKNSHNQYNQNIKLLIDQKYQNDGQNESRELVLEEKGLDSISILNYSTQNKLNVQNLNSKIIQDSNKYKNQYISRQNVQPISNEQEQQQKLQFKGMNNQSNQLQSSLLQSTVGDNSNQDKKSKYLNQGVNKSNKTLPQQQRRENITSPLSNVSTTQVVQLNLNVKSDHQKSK